MAESTSGKNKDLLDAVICSHGGLERFNQIQSIDVKWNFRGRLLEIKGYPGHFQPTISIDTKRQYAILRRLGEGIDDKFVFTPQRTWVERRDASVVESIADPRASFAGHVRTTPWTKNHLGYFVSYAMHNYITFPFCCATVPGVRTRELEEHQERGETWRVLEVTFPDSFATHCKVQKFYFDEKFMLQRMDYTTDVAGGVVAHYCFDHKEIGGIVFPTFRRVIRRDQETDMPLISGPSSFLLDYIEINIRDV